MKKIYFRTIVALAFIAASFPQNISAQCTCAGGIPATAIIYNSILAPTNLPSATITLPQFDPTTLPGFDLSCVTLFDTLSGVTISGARNLNSSTALLPPSNPIYSPTGRMEYAFLLVVSANVVGPGINQIKSFNQDYGPDSLGAYGQPDDTITYGPTNLFTNFPSSKASTNVGAYIGTGTVSFSYNILGNLNVTEGSINFRQQITATYSGKFGLAYYLCPSSPLATTVSYFSALKHDKTVDLQWLAANFQNNTLYEVQFSKNGEDFASIGNIPAGTASAGTISEYHYQYDLNPTDVGSVYFRIKRVEADGHSSYSAVKLINLESNGSMGIQTYPNPVVDLVKVQFANNQQGHFLLELVNISGQVVQQKALTLNGSNQVDFSLSSHPARGMYVLRAKDLSHNKQYITKVQVQ
jgi:Secretion system C-terminal sorting domain